MNKNRMSATHAALLAAAAVTGLGFMTVGTDGVRVINGSEVSSTTAGTQRSPGAELKQTRAAEQTTNLSRTGERNAIAKAMFGGFGSFRPKRFPNGPGWTHAHVQRMARKRRNKQRNRKAHR